MENKDTLLLNVEELKEKEKKEQIKKIIAEVYLALKEKGYNPIMQMTGYLLSGDPTYITAHNGARYMIRKVEKDEIIDTLIEEYVKDLN